MIKEIDFGVFKQFLTDNKAHSEGIIYPNSAKKAFGYYSNGDLIGVISYDEKEGFYKIKGTFVDRNRRREGIGTMLSNFVLSRLSGKKVVSYATEMNINIRLKQGFVIKRKFRSTYLIEKPI